MLLQESGPSPNLLCWENAENVIFLKLQSNFCQITPDLCDRKTDYALKQPLPIYQVQADYIPCPKSGTWDFLLSSPLKKSCTVTAGYLIHGAPSCTCWPSPLDVPVAPMSRRLRNSDLDLLVVAVSPFIQEFVDTFSLFRNEKCEGRRFLAG